jgi:hypothetical protein
MWSSDRHPSHTWLKGGGPTEHVGPSATIYPLSLISASHQRRQSHPTKTQLPTMYFSKPLIVLPLVMGLAAAAPKPPCTPQTSCTATATVPEPTDRRCGVAGQAHFVAGVIIADVTKKGCPVSQCASDCFANDQCQSFAFDPEMQRCLTFRETPLEMGFRKYDTSNFQFWHRDCWNYHCTTTSSCSSPAPAATAT